MFFKVRLGRTTSISIFGAVGVYVSGEEVGFRYYDRTLIISRRGVTATNMDWCDYAETAQPVSTDFGLGGGSGIWCREVTVNGVCVRVRSTVIGKNTCEVSINIEDDAVIVSTLNDSPEVIVIGSSDAWCKAILSMMGYEEPDDKPQKGVK